MVNSTILIVDDDPVILKFVRTNLHTQGCNVMIANNGQMALKVLDETQSKHN